MLTIDLDGLRHSFLHLFDDPAVCVREILQNSYEAIRIRRHQDAGFNGGAIRAWHEGEFLHFSDDGIGMPPEKMNSMLGKLFASEWAESGSGPGIGQFGMGLKTCFLVSDELTIRSTVAGSTETWEWHLNGSVGGEPKISRVEKPDTSGTVVSLRLTVVTCKRQRIDAPQILGRRTELERLVRHYAEYLACPVFVENQQSNLGGLPGFDQVDQRPNEWFKDHFSEDGMPLAEFALSALSGAPPFRSLLFALPAHSTSEPKIIIHRQGVRVADIPSEDIFPPHGHRLVGLVDAPDFDLYVDRHRVRQGLEFEAFKEHLANAYDHALIRLSEEKTYDFGVLVSSSESLFKLGFCLRPALRQAVGGSVRYRRADNNRPISLSEALKLTPVRQGQPVLFYQTDSAGQASLMPLYRDFGIPVLKAPLVIEDVNLDVVFLQAFANDHGAMLRRVDQGLELVLEQSTEPADVMMKDRLEGCIEPDERLVVFRHAAAQDAVLYRIADDAVSADETQRKGDQREREAYAEMLKSISGRESSTALWELEARAQASRRRLIFINAVHPVIQQAWNLKDMMLFQATTRLLILDAFTRSGLPLSHSQAQHHHASLATVLEALGAARSR